MTSIGKTDVRTRDAKANQPETPKALQMQGFEGDCRPLSTVETPIPEGGLEPPRGLPSLDFESSAARSQLLNSQQVAPTANSQLHSELHQLSETDPELARVIKAWQHLPDHAKATIMGIVAMSQLAK
ncbi:MAG: hypothetical protein O3A00_00650 [Planctomycetota bacterium]|nr:hypothetical protein [Planctomycetota bacterium]